MKKDKNPWIKIAVMYYILTALYIACTCYFAVSDNLPLTIIYAILTPIWGGIAGYWTFRADNFKYETYQRKLTELYIECYLDTAHNY